MPRDKALSHKKVMAAALEEFTEYGFENASMRRIGSRCGMTAAALYRHCADKADLFDQLVVPAAERMDAWMQEHISHSFETVETGKGDFWRDTEIDMMREVIYPHIPEYRLLLTKARGTRHADFLQRTIDHHEKEMQRIFPLMKERGYPVMEVSNEELHILVSAYTMAIFEPVIQNYTLEDALKCIDTLEKFFLPAWKMMMGF